MLIALLKLSANNGSTSNYIKFHINLWETPFLKRVVLSFIRQILLVNQTDLKKKKYISFKSETEADFKISRDEEQPAFSPTLLLPI